MLAEDEQADELYRAVPAADLAGWPLHQARLLLAHGTRLAGRAAGRHGSAAGRLPVPAQ